MCTRLCNSCCSTSVQVVTAGHDIVLMFYRVTNVPSFCAREYFYSRWLMNDPRILIGSYANKLNGWYKWVIYMLTRRLLVPAGPQRAWLVANTLEKPVSCCWSSWRRSFNGLQGPLWFGQWHAFHHFNLNGVRYAEVETFWLYFKGFWEKKHHKKYRNDKW